VLTSFPHSLDGSETELFSGLPADIPPIPPKPRLPDLSNQDDDDDDDGIIEEISPTRPIAQLQSTISKKSKRGADQVDLDGEPDKKRQKVDEGNSNVIVIDD
jgi:hypothetical protein